MSLLCIGGEVPGGIQLSLFDVGGDEVHRQQVHDDVLGLRLRMALGSMVPSFLSVLRDDVRVHVFRCVRTGRKKINEGECPVSQRSPIKIRHSKSL